MKCIIEIKNKRYSVDLNQPIDLSTKIKSENDNLAAWYVSPPKITPVKDGDFVGSVALGGSVNFREITFNPHGHGTHTESVGHIDKSIYPITEALKTFHFYAYLISVKPTVWKKNEGTREIGDQIITLNLIKAVIDNYTPEALLIRTTPNTDEKLSKNYSSTNPPYLCDEAASYMARHGVKHLLIDLPSVDKEVDNGELKAHKAFWLYPENTRYNCTITELFYAPVEINDGEYLLNLQTASFENDASPSKPILFKLENNEH